MTTIFVCLQLRQDRVTQRLGRHRRRPVARGADDQHVDLVQGDDLERDLRVVAGAKRRRDVVETRPRS